MQEVDLGAEDYDEETDEFAGYSGSNAHLFQNNSSTQSGQNDSKGSAHLGSSKASTNSKSTKSKQQRQREKDMKEVKMYYWTKVDQGDTDEVYKVLNYAQLQFKGENEMF